MIDVGELKIGDRVLDKLNNKFGTVIDIEYNRLIDDECELITIKHDGLNTLVLIRTPLEEKFIEKLKNKGDKKMIQEEFDINYMGKFPRKEYKIIFNDPATILFVNGKKYVAKAHDEEFDCEKGALVCLMKSFGISHLDLKRMIKNAKVQSKGKKTSTNKEEIYVNGEKFEQPELDSKREKLYKDIPQRNSEDNMTKIPFHFDVPTSDIDSGFKVPMVEEKVVVSPKGKHRGSPYNFNVGDKVIVRDCKYYKYTTNTTAKGLLNKIWEISLDNSDFAGSLYVINGVEFAGSELEPVKD